MFIGLAVEQFTSFSQLIVGSALISWYTMTIVVCIFVRREGRTYINITSASTSLTGRGLSSSFAMILPLLMVLMTPSSTTTALCDRRVILAHAHFVGFLTYIDRRVLVHS